MFFYSLIAMHVADSTAGPVPPQFLTFVAFLTALAFLLTIGAFVMAYKLKKITDNRDIK